MKLIVTNEQLAEILELHKKWHSGKEKAYDSYVYQDNLSQPLSEDNLTITSYDEIMALNYE